MQKVKLHDFIEMDFIARIKSSNEVFDLTNAEEAKKHNLYNSKQTYKPLVFCVGVNQVIQGLDKQIEGKEIGKTYTIEIPQEYAFGKKDSRLIKIINSNIFIKQKINPVVGLPVNVDNAYGVIRSVAGGRVIVDFNHPLSGKDLIYEVKINKIIEDDVEKIKCLLNFNLPLKDPIINIKNKIAEITVPVDIPEKLQEEFNKNFNLIPSIKKIVFLKKEQIKPKSKSN